MSGKSSEHAYQQLNNSGQSSATPSRPGSPTGAHKRGRVRFNSTSEANDTTNKRSSLPLRDKGDPSISPILKPTHAKTSPLHSRSSSATNLLRHSNIPELEKADPLTEPLKSPVLKPRPGVLRNSSYARGQDDGTDELTEQAFSALAAHERAQRMATLVGSNSAPATRRTSLEPDVDDSFLPLRSGSARGFLANIPLGDLDSRRTYDGVAEMSDDEHTEKEKSKKDGATEESASTAEAHKIVRAHTRKTRSGSISKPTISESSAPPSGAATPYLERDYDEYIPRPQQFRGGVLSELLKLYKAPALGESQPVSRAHSRRSSFESVASTAVSAGSSGNNTPKVKHPKWYAQKSHSQDTLAGLIEASAKLAAAPATPKVMSDRAKKPVRPGTGKRQHSGKFGGAVMNKIRPRLEDEIKITIHIAETLARQKYVVKLCRALIMYGAPTHRLEEYLNMTSRVIEIDSSCLYIPGCMIISFDDATTHTTEVKLVKSPHGVSLGKLKDVHEVYKEVVHDVIGVEEATQRLDEIIKAKPKYSAWVRVIVYGLASATVGPFAFEARLIDLPIAFILGCLLGYLQLILAPKSDLYSNVFEISAAVLTSFLARAFGSIRGGDIFCFSALAQSSIALILPGYLVLCASLELQSRSIVAGSVRIVYAIIYSLFLGFGITIGTAAYSLFDSNASTATTCSNPINQYYRWFFVPAFTLCLAIINHAKWKQTPVMLVIAFAGYVVNFFSNKRFPSSPQISNTLGALCVGVLGNLYSRINHGVAVVALLPAIFVQVPSGIAASGSLIQGLNTAETLSNNATYANGTSRVTGTNQVSVTSSTDLNTIAFNVGYNMIQVAIGITVGLFLSALIVYPLGKRRSGLFSF
ncbi:hypothetical protein B0O99DRAFT_655293 [Bisporella sp. PMI_857]|nr:hypothetical protein B0O99DRAFT_655293 [Bisporella sp. PMI_857]